MWQTCIAGLLCLAIGTQTYPFLLAWNGENKRTEHLYVSDDTNSGAARFYARNDTGLNWATAMAAHASGDGQAVGVFGYGETDGIGTTWGANFEARSYSKGAAIGVEVNGLNKTDQPNNDVYGISVINGGDAATGSAILIETAKLDPKGKPRYGIHLRKLDNEAAPASEAGIRIDQTDSHVALQVATGEKIVLSSDGNTYLVFDGSHIALIRNGKIRGLW